MNIRKTFKAIMVPRFSTEEVESSRLRSNLIFEASSFFFDDGKKGYPTLVLGWITTTRDHLIRAAWNKYGECTVQGKRIKSFDLIRPTQGEIDSARSIAESMVAGLIVIIICIIF